MISAASEKRYAAAARASVSLIWGYNFIMMKIGLTYGLALQGKRPYRASSCLAGGLQLGEYPTPLEATGMSLIGIALAMLAWLPRASEPASTA